MTQLCSWLPRPSLKWLSRKKVALVRNKIIGLYLGEGERLTVPSPILSDKKAPLFNETLVRYLAGGLVFDYFFNGTMYSAYLKIPKDRNPHFQLEYKKPNTSLIREDCFAYEEGLSFRDKRLQIPVLLLKQFLKDFPYKPTDNYLQNGGDFVC